MPKLPRITPVTGLLILLGFLMISTMLYSRESLLFCERALFGEMNTIAKEGTADKPIKFTEVCPEIRARHENSVNKWLEVILALMVQFTAGSPRE